MHRTEIEKHIERVFLEGWNYSEGDPGYFQSKAHQVEAFARGLQSLAGRPVRIDRPANLQNFYRLEVCFTSDISASRDELPFETVRARGEVIYLDTLHSVILPVAEASWRRFTVPGTMLDQEVHDLLNDAWLGAHPELEQIAYGVMELAQAHGLELLASDILRQPANPALPVPFPGTTPATLRDFVFPGVFD
jgi:hypothetical protein